MQHDTLQHSSVSGGSYEMQHDTLQHSSVSGGNYEMQHDTLQHSSVSGGNYESNRSKAAKARNYNPCCVCQQMRKKCDGMVPCHWCREIRKKPEECKPGRESKKARTRTPNVNRAYPDISSTFQPSLEDIAWFINTSKELDILQDQFPEIVTASTSQQDLLACRGQATVNPAQQQPNIAFNYHEVQPEHMLNSAIREYPNTSTSGHAMTENFGAYPNVSQQQLPFPSSHMGGNASLLQNGYTLSATDPGSLSPIQADANNGAELYGTTGTASWGFDTYYPTYFNR